MSHIIRILVPRHTEEIVEYRREFLLVGTDDGSGFSFPTDITGKVDTSDSNYSAWKNNYKTCLANPDKYKDNGCKKFKYTYTQPAEAVCSCGAHVILEGDCCCEGCEQWYSQFGQSLVDPQYWDVE